VIDERIALPRERAPDQYVPWGHNGQLKLFRTGEWRVPDESLDGQDAY
jgi:hypothetical protein